MSFFIWLLVCVSSAYSITFLNEEIIFLESSELEPAASNVLKNANLISMTKSILENDRNLATKIVAIKWDDEKKDDAEVSREKVMRDLVFFEVRRSDYNMEKVNLPENTLLYSTSHTSQFKKTKIFIIAITTYLER